MHRSPYRLTVGLSIVLLLLAAALPATAANPTPSPSPTSPSSTPGSTVSPTPTPSPTGGVDPNPSASSGPFAFDGALAVNFVSGEGDPLPRAQVTLHAVLGRGAALAYRQNTDQNGIARFTGLPRPAHGSPPLMWELDARLTRVTVDGPCTTTVRYRGSETVPASSVPRGITIVADDGGSSISCRTVVTTPRPTAAPSITRTGARPASARGGSEPRRNEAPGSEARGGGAQGPRVAVRAASPVPGLTPPATDAGVARTAEGDVPLVGLVLLLAAATVALVAPPRRRSR